MLRGQLKGKRGFNGLLLFFTGLVLSLVIATSFIYAGGTTAQKTSYLKRYYADDIAMTLEAVQAMPGDVELRYPLEEDFIITITEDEVQIGHKDNSLEELRLFLHFPGIKIRTGQAQDILVVTKKNNIITINEEKSLTCEKPMGLLRTIRVRTAQGSSILHAQDLQLIQESIEVAFEQENREQEEQTELQIVLAAEEKQELSENTIDYVFGEPGEENAPLYNYLFCEWEKGENIRYDENIPDGEIQIIFSMNATDKETFMRTRGNFAQELLGVLS